MAWRVRLCYVVAWLCRILTCHAVKCLGMQQHVVSCYVVAWCHVIVCCSVSFVEWLAVRFVGAMALLCMKFPTVAWYIMASVCFLAWRDLACRVMEWCTALASSAASLLLNYTHSYSVNFLVSPAFSHHQTDSALNHIVRLRVNPAFNPAKRATRDFVR